ncbi:MAG: hypothetical protein ACTHN8_18360 [Angustibacter sp.]
MRGLTFARLARALDGWQGGVLVVLGVVLVVSVSFLPGDLRGQRLAQQVRDSGVPALATDVEVHVDKDSGKGGPTYDVDRVRVRLADRSQPVLLAALAEGGRAVDSDDPHEGWQRPSAGTGYDDDPLDVRTARGDGRDVVMAQDDVDYWSTDNHDVRTDVSIAVACLVGALVWTAGCLTYEQREQRRRRAARRRRR